MTLGRLFNERVIVQERINGQMATQATLTFQAVAGAFNGKESIKDFNKAIKRLTDGD